MIVNLTFSDATAARGALLSFFYAVGLGIPFILAGLACYVVSVVVWVIGLSKVPVSIAYPMLSIGYVINAIFDADSLVLVG